MIKKRLVGLLSHAKKYIVYQVVWQWLALICQIVVIFCAARLLELALFREVTLPEGLTWGATAAAALILRFVCDRRASHASYRASVDVKRILRDKIYQKLLRLGASYREKVTTSEIVQMAAEGVEQLEVYFGKYLSQLIYSLTAPVTLFVVLSFVNWKASLVLLVCVPLIPVSIVAVQKVAGRLLKKYWGIYTELGDSFLENLQGLTTLKIYRSDQKKAEEMDEESQRFRRITMKVLTMQLNSTSVMDIIAYGGAAVGMIVTLSEFAKGNVSFHGTLMLVLLAAEFFIPLRLLGFFFHIAMNGMAASDKIFALLDLPEPREAEQELEYGKMRETDRGDRDRRQPGGEKTPGYAPMDIRFSGVHFSYEADREILKGVHMEFPAGSFTSIVGTSGCGKSTAAAVLMGRNRGYTGSVTVQGKELSEIREESLMEHIALVSHNSYLFKGTVAENLRMGKPDASAGEMREVLAKVNLWGFLEQQQGLETPVMEKGANFSGGQCQRMAIARALLHDTPVYIFDEATSNIDAESEEMIMAVIHDLAKTKTIILISHRLANVVNSDRIYMMKDGAVAETGTHEMLMSRGGAYAKLYRSQMELEEYGRSSVKGGRKEAAV